eukprot:scaffold574076_cov20-Prasinocladus_malaysianus.AAC.1
MPFSLNSLLSCVPIWSQRYDSETNKTQIQNFDAKGGASIHIIVLWCCRMGNRIVGYRLVNTAMRQYKTLVKFTDQHCNLARAVLIA